MSNGPILIFDKSTLQSLNADEAVWLDNFFLTNITPLFFIETLADLEKQVRAGRTPEQVVGDLAYKTPDMQSRPNVHHATLLQGELTGVANIEMRGVPIISGGQPVVLGGKAGVIFRQAPEEEALQRWHDGQFLEVERMTAKAWRRNLSGINFEDAYKFFQRYFERQNKPTNLAEVKELAESILDASDQEASLTLGMGLIGVPQHSKELVIARWRQAGRPLIREFAPYARYVFSVDLFFNLGIAADLISRQRPSHKVDIAYLYYLPFCMVFTSNDKLHANVAPLFLGPHQTFVIGSELKGDLSRLDDRYSAFSPDVKNKGVFHFAAYPPTDTSFLVTRLWDKHLPAWRGQHAEQLKKEPLSKEEQEALLKLINRFEKESTPLDPKTQLRPEEVHQMTIQRQVYARKGKWKRFPPEVEEAHRKGEQ